MYNDKKGEVSTAFKLILAVIVVIVLVLIFRNLVSGGTKMIKCGQNNGQCVDKSLGCSQGQFPYPAIDCKVEQDCCLNDNKKISESDLDSSCSGKSNGQACTGLATGENYVCMQGYCISKCEYCVRTNDNTTCAVNVGGKNITWNSQFICGCDESECKTFSNDGKCLFNAKNKAGSVIGFCSSLVYCCAR